MLLTVRIFIALSYPTIFLVLSIIVVLVERIIFTVTPVTIEKKAIVVYKDFFTPVITVFINGGSGVFYISSKCKNVSDYSFLGCAKVESSKVVSCQNHNFICKPS